MPSSLTVDDYDHNYIALSWQPPEIPYGNVDLYRIRYQGFKDLDNEVQIHMVVYQDCIQALRHIHVYCSLVPRLPSARVQLLGVQRSSLTIIAHVWRGAWERGYIHVHVYTYMHIHVHAGYVLRYSC